MATWWKHENYWSQEKHFQALTRRICHCWKSWECIWTCFWSWFGTLLKILTISTYFNLKCHLRCYLIYGWYFRYGSMGTALSLVLLLLRILISKQLNIMLTHITFLGILKLYVKIPKLKNMSWESSLKSEKKTRFFFFVFFLFK